MTEQGQASSATPPALASREEALANLFVALADTLVADFDFVELLDRLVATCVELFEVNAAAVLVLDAKGRLRLVSSTNERAERLEIFQVQVDEGPCLDCARSRMPVTVTDLQAEQARWPRFAAAAEIVGFRSVHAVPLRLRSEGLGALGLFHGESTAFAGRDLHTIQALADVATIGLLQQQHAQQASIINEQLQGALDSRVAIEQAKGILAEAGNVEMDVAFQQLRRYCRDHNLKLSYVAHAVANREIAAAEVVAATKHLPR